MLHQTMKVKAQKGSKHSTRLANGALPAEAKRTWQLCGKCEKAFQAAMDNYKRLKALHDAKKKEGSFSIGPVRPRRSGYVCPDCVMDYKTDHYDPNKPKPKAVVVVKKSEGESRKKALDKAKPKRVKQRERKAGKNAKKATAKQVRTAPASSLKAQWCATFGKDKGGIYRTPENKLLTKGEAKIYFAQTELDNALHEKYRNGELVSRKVDWKSSFELWPIPGTEKI